KNHYPWENPGATMPSPPPRASHDEDRRATDENAVGHTRDEPAEEVVTTATSTVAPRRAAVKSGPAAAGAPRPKLDYAFLRQQVTMEQVLKHLDLWSQLRGPGEQRRGPCPVHHPSPASERTFSVHL